MRIYNSMSGKLEDFKPINENHVNMYVCGPTLYSDIHIGNARPIIFFDVVARFLTMIGYQVKYVSNITDVDDKIINRAEVMGINEMELVNQNIKKFKAVLNNLNVIDYNVQPRVTEYMPQIIEFIEDLVKKGFAYEVDGNVYFRIDKVSEYGKLSKRDIENLAIGNRIEVNNEKENPADFTLWKKTEKGIKWDSSFSKGRPGWHTECVVMIHEIFGNQPIDIHGGGMDLKFPHHENELAQSCACNNKLTNLWMHNGFINIDNEKMSKSIGNVINTETFVNKYGANVTRLLMLQTNYRQPINLTDEFIESTNKINQKLQKIANNYCEVELDFNSPLVKEALVAMENDFSTSNLISLMLSSFKGEFTIEQAQLFKFGCDVLGLKYEKEVQTEIPQEIKELVELRKIAKAAKDFNRADAIREQILDLGYEIKDTRGGITWNQIKK